MVFCLFYRWKISARLDTGLEPGPGLERHVQECAACREFYHEQRVIADGLVKVAGQERRAPSPFLQRRIMAGLGAGSEPRPASSHLGWVVSAAAAAITLLLVLRVLHGTPAPAPAATTAELSGVLKQAAALDRQLPDRQELGQWSSTVAQPLDKEMQLLFHDARGAAQMLVQNFLPQSLARSLDEPQGQ